MNPKIKIVLGVIGGLIVVTGGLLAYVKLQSNSKTKTSDTSKNTTKTTSQNTDNTVNGAPGRVTDTPAFFPTLSYDGRDLWYFTSDGQLLRMILETGVKQKYKMKNTVQPTNVVWPARGDNFIIETVSGSTKKVSFYNSLTKDFIDYSPNIKHANFMPDGNHVVYNWVDEKGKSSLSQANSDSSNFHKLVDMPEGDLMVQASPSGKGYLAYNASNPANHNLYYISGEGAKPLVIKTSLSNAAAWSPKGDKFVFNKFDPSASGPNSILWIGSVDSGNQSDKTLGLNSSINKIAFDPSGKLLYIAVSESGGDSLWKYNIETGAKTELYKPSDFKTKTTFTNMLASPEGKWLYYVNADGYVYGIDISK